jgi:hypothetical protein
MIDNCSSKVRGLGLITSPFTSICSVKCVVLVGDDKMI